MKRQNPLLTPVGLSLTLVLFLGLALSLLLQGGKAFSPGALTALNRSGVNLQGFDSHAAFESECRRCHQPLKSMQADLCLDCHQDVNEEIGAQAGVHAKIDQVERCFTCHSDHHGRDFDPTQAALARFDHSAAHFSLIWHQVGYDLAPMPCSACHDPQSAGFAASDQLCQSCHASHDQAFIQTHQASYGTVCVDCHDGLDSMARFDHAASAFPLQGAHIQAACDDCHAGGKFKETSTACQSCHAEPDVHRGFYAQDCSACHTPDAWKPAVLDGAPFDHNLSTAFSLALHDVDFQGQSITCQACHTPGSGDANLPACIDCHAAQDAAFMTEHRQQFGDNCLSCHDGADAMSNFDHNRFFLLDGRHLEIDCVDCHANQVYAGTPSQCSACHPEPEIHAGYFGLACQDCHTTTAWSPAYLREHSFPLNHGEGGEVQCQVCHPSNYVEYTCYGCHDHQLADIQAKHQEEGISFAEMVECASCHPTGQKDEGEGGGGSGHND